MGNGLAMGGNVNQAMYNNIIRVLLLLCNDYRFDHSLVIKNFYPNHCAVFIGA